MSRIDELSDRPQYHIKTVYALTGIRPVTLRAWERRYRLLKPQRTSGNYRMYSEQDIAMLRWLKSRVDSGLPISAAASELSEMRRSGSWPESLPPVERPVTAQSAHPPAEFAERLYAALAGMDEGRANSLLNEAHAVFDLTTICMHILTPCLWQIGEAWHRGELRIVAEHFASNYLRGRLLSLFQAYPLNPGSPRILVGCAPGELHELGPLMLALLLRRDGFRVEFLGADLFLEDLLDYARQERPALICLAANSEPAARSLQRVQESLARMRPRPRFGFGGRAFNDLPRLLTEIPGIFLGETLDEACRSVRELLLI